MRKDPQPIPPHLRSQTSFEIYSSDNFVDSDESERITPPYAPSSNPSTSYQPRQSDKEVNNTFTITLSFV